MSCGPGGAETPDIGELYGLFADDADRPTAEVIAAEEMPEPYRRLLAHNHHMTVTVEGHYGGPVDVAVLDVREEADVYARKILLALRDGGRVVQFGLVRIHLNCCSPEVRAEILARRTPLGRILIQHNVLRHIEPRAFLRVEPAAKMAEWFGLPRPQTTYGRLGVIFFEGRPAIEVLEILAPAE